MTLFPLSFLSGPRVRVTVLACNFRDFPSQSGPFRLSNSKLHQRVTQNGEGRCASVQCSVDSLTLFSKTTPNRLHVFLFRDGTVPALITFHEITPAEQIYYHNALRCRLSGDLLFAALRNCIICRRHQHHDFWRASVDA